MDAEKAAEELRVIRNLMERPIRYSTMSGLSGIFAGLVALAGVAVDNWISVRCDQITAVWANILTWVCVFVVAATGVLALTRIRERGQQMPFWSSVKKRILMTILPPFLAGVGLTLVIIARWYPPQVGPNQWGLIPAVWMLFYGAALCQVGLFSAVEVRLLGVAFIAGGLVSAMWFQTSPYWALGLTFGGLHIIYGTIVRIRYGG